MSGAPDEGQEAFVVFTGQADWPWLRMLKPGYKHCFVLLRDGGRWLSMDPMLNHTEIQIHGVPGDFDMAAWLRGRGHRVVRAVMCRDHKKPAPFMIFTCVEAVKRVLGLHDWRIVTPWQLYRALTSLSNSPSPLRGEGRGEGAVCPTAAPLPPHPTLSPRGRGLFKQGDLSWET
jgi:hypothetical protein